MHLSLVATFIMNCVGYLRHTKLSVYTCIYILHTLLSLKQITEYQFPGKDEMLDPQRYLQHFTT